jgi:hypothetical protein
MQLLKISKGFHGTPQKQKKANTEESQKLKFYKSLLSNSKSNISPNLDSLT